MSWNWRIKQLGRSVPNALRLLCSAAIALACGSASRAEDWPTYQHDYARSGVSAEKLPFPLTEAWTHRARQKPQPAWPGPAREDLYNKVQNLRPRMTFDKVFHVVAAGDSAYFGSSADDQVYALDAATGKKRWSFFAEAPVRFAPTIVGERLYLGADDGRVYCIARADGKQVWRRDPPEQDYRLPGNGRVISLWAVRSSVVVADDTAYFSSGLFPKEGVFVNAIAAADGTPRWRTAIPDRPAQGYLLASATRLYVPTGRENPLVFERATGKSLQAVSGAGGTYALLAGDTLIFGPGKAGELGVVEPGESEQLATFAGNHMLVAGGIFYLHANDRLRALDQTRYVELARRRRELNARKPVLTAKLKALGSKVASAEGLKLSAELAAVGNELNKVHAEIPKCVKWDMPCPQALALVMAGDTLIAGGDGEVAAYSGTDGKEIWKSKVDGAAYGLTVANGRLFVSTDLGVIQCFE
jgi:outer membrane protein assembly factor BamB